MFVSYSRKGDKTYAKMVTSRRIGGVVAGETSNLGRVVDRERHVFRSRERGTSALDPGTGELGPAPAGGWPVPPERLVLDFGDAWALDSLATSEGLWGGAGRGVAVRLRLVAVDTRRARCPDGAGEANRGPVERPRALERPRHGRDRRLPAELGALVAQGPGVAPEAPSAPSVEEEAGPFGRPSLAMPSSRPPGRGTSGLNWGTGPDGPVGTSRRWRPWVAMAPRAWAHDRGAEGDAGLPPRERRPRGVAMGSARGRDPPLVAPPHLPPHTPRHLRGRLGGRACPSRRAQAPGGLCPVTSRDTCP